MEQPVRLTVNGREHQIRGDPERPLLDVLRGELGLAGPRFGCGAGLCGACFVLVDGKPRSSCDLPAAAAAGRDIVTVEGVGAGGGLHPVQRAFIDEQAAQCGYCTSGMVISAVGPTHGSPPSLPAYAARALVQALPKAGVKRLLVVGGAGSLEVKPGLQLVDSPEFPASWKPGENATTRWKRSPLINPSERAYVAPSENPPTATRAGSTATESNTRSSARSTNITSGPKPPRMASQLEARESGASTATPASSAADPRRRSTASPRPPAP